MRQTMNPSALRLFEHAASIKVIDTHEHLPVKEHYYTDASIEFSDLFIPYITNDINSAGMVFPQDQWPALVRVSPDWKVFGPVWKNIRHGSYARALRGALSRYYGEDDLTENNYEYLLEQINLANKPGIFKRILQEDCHIEKVITCQNALPDREDEILKGIVYLPCVTLNNPVALASLLSQAAAGPLRDLEDLVKVCDRWMEIQATAGAVGFKATALWPAQIEYKTAQGLLERIIAGETLAEEHYAPLAAYLREQHARKAGELDLPVTVHTGVWNDFRSKEVREAIGLVARNPATRFVIYHFGIPSPREAIQLVKNFPNAYLDLCWSHIVAPDMVVQSLKEAFDMLPLNKLFAFGGDHVFFVEQIYSHLEMAKENVSLVLGDRVDRGYLGHQEACEIMELWFYHNPASFFRLETSVNNKTIEGVTL